MKRRRTSKEDTVRYDHIEIVQQSKRNVNLQVGVERDIIDKPDHRPLVQCCSLFPKSLITLRRHNRPVQCTSYSVMPLIIHILLQRGATISFE